MPIDVAIQQMHQEDKQEKEQKNRRTSVKSMVQGAPC
jgi:hypothetical protein